MRNIILQLKRKLQLAALFGGGAGAAVVLAGLAAPAIPVAPAAPAVPAIPAFPANHVAPATDPQQAPWNPMGFQSGQQAFFASAPGAPVAAPVPSVPVTSAAPDTVPQQVPWNPMEFQMSRQALLAAVTTGLVAPVAPGTAPQQPTDENQKPTMPTPSDREAPVSRPNKDDINRRTAIRNRKIKKDGRTCSNCSTEVSTNWRNSKLTGMPVCNACGMYEQSNKRPRPKAMRNDQIQRRHHRHTDTIPNENEAPPTDVVTNSMEQSDAPRSMAMRNDYTHRRHTITTPYENEASLPVVRNTTYSDELLSETMEQECR